MTNNNKQYLL